VSIRLHYCGDIVIPVVCSVAAILFILQGNNEPGTRRQAYALLTCVETSISCLSHVARRTGGVYVDQSAAPQVKVIQDVVFFRLPAWRLQVQHDGEGWVLIIRATHYDDFRPLSVADQMVQMCPGAVDNTEDMRQLRELIPLKDRRVNLVHRTGYGTCLEFDFDKNCIMDMETRPDSRYGSDGSYLCYYRTRYPGSIILYPTLPLVKCKLNGSLSSVDIPPEMIRFVGDNPFFQPPTASEVNRVGREYFRSLGPDSCQQVIDRARCMISTVQSGKKHSVVECMLDNWDVDLCISADVPGDMVVCVSWFLC